MEIDIKSARALAIRAQGLSGSKPASVEALTTQVGAIQLDTISVLARSHELAAYARMGAISRQGIEDAYWGRSKNGEPRSFEYWSHAASILPIANWPLYGFRRRANAKKEWAWFTEHKKATRAVIERLRAEGPMTATDLGGAKRGGQWWDWSEAKIAVEYALYRGDVVCTERRGWKRVYDLAERAIPARLLNEELPDEECIKRLVQHSGEALGVATVKDLADYQRLSVAQVLDALPDTSLVEVSVRGWSEPAFASPILLESDQSMRTRYRTTPLSPFDSLVWYRKRTERLFGFAHLFEAYVPKEKRVHGYFNMPILARTEIVGHIDPKREGKTLVIANCTFIPGTEARVAKAISEAAEWVAADSVRIDHAHSQTALRSLRKLFD